MKLEYALCTTSGNHYKGNQDCILFNGQTYQQERHDEQGLITLAENSVLRAAISDGASESPHPAFASRTLLKGLHKLDQKNLNLPPSEMCHELRDYLLKGLRTNRKCLNAAATLVTAEISQSRTRVWHAGDSRAYRYCIETNKLVQLTKDHCIFNDLARDYPELAENPDLYEGTILKGVDNLFTVSPYYDAPSSTSTLVDWKTGDILMLCSDGLTENLSNEAIEQRFVPDSCEETVENLIAKSLTFPVSDNISIICIKRQ